MATVEIVAVNIFLRRLF